MRDVPLVTQRRIINEAHNKDATYILNTANFNSIIFININNSILALLDKTAGLGTFLEIFSAFGITVSPSKVLLYFVIAVVSASFFILIISYFAAKNIRYEFYKNKMIAYQSSLLVLVNSKEIPYQNIARVSYSKQGFMNNIFDSGTIAMQLSGLKEESIKLVFIDNIEQVVQYIQGLVRDYMYTKQAQFTQNYKIGSILTDKIY